MRLIIPSLVWQGPLFCLPPRRSGNLWMPIGFHASWGWTRTYFYGVPDSALYRFVLSRSKRKFRLNYVTREQQEIDNSLKVLINASALSDARFHPGVNVGKVLRARSIKPFARPLAIAVDAGLMQIQLWEGAVLRSAETGPQRVTHETMCQ